jgi:DNA mismatch repair protein MutS
LPPQTEECFQRPHCGVTQPSILFPQNTSHCDLERSDQPACFPDLNLDQVVAAVATGREDYDLKPFFYSTSRDVEVIRFRHEVFRDLEQQELVDGLCEFASAMTDLRRNLARADKLYYERQKQRIFLDAVDVYCTAIRALKAILVAAAIKSEGLRRFHHHLETVIASDEFSKMESQVQKLIAELGQIRYALLIYGKRVSVRRYAPEPDYSADVLETFLKFSQGSGGEHRFRFATAAEMNHVEAAILDRVALLFPKTFTALGDFCLRYKNSCDPVVLQFDREVQFYLAWLEFRQRIERTGLAFCYPTLSNNSKAQSATDAFDLALAEKLRGSNRKAVTNGFSLSGEERMLIVTGPNQGGKTTFARMFGQLHYLAALGCPVPARQAHLFLCDQIFTHFDSQEQVENLTGKLEDELWRIRKVLVLATPDSVLIMNESFLSTTVDDALFISREVLGQVVERGMLCVFVTFLDELASFNASTVSMVCEVDPADPARRTFRIVRRPANGLAYALALAEKHRLGRTEILKRIAANTRKDRQ